MEAPPATSGQPMCCGNRDEDEEEDVPVVGREKTSGVEGEGCVEQLCHAYSGKT